MGKHSWVMYVALIIIVGLLLRNAAGSVGLMLAGGQAGGQLIGALEGPASSKGGYFSFGNTSFNLRGQ